MSRPEPTIHLDQTGKLEVFALLEAGLPLPERYRAILFPAEESTGQPEYGRTPRRSASTATGPGHSLAQSGMELQPTDCPLQVQEIFPDRAASPACSGRAAWQNLLIQGDNLDVLRSLAHGPLKSALAQAGGIKLVYMDPPFDVGADFYMPLETGGSGEGRSGEGGGKDTRPRARAFKDTWGQGPASFSRMLYRRLVLIRELMAEDGCIFVHCDRRTGPRIRLFLDHIFGPERFLGEIIWHYTGGGRSRRYFSRKHDTILQYAKSAQWTFNLDEVRVPYKPGSGYARGGIVSAAGKRYLPHPLGTPVDDVWDLPIINPLSHERTAYPTQKPEALLERIIRSASHPGDLVADFFSGSGTTAVVAERLGRNWLAVDSGRQSVHCARKRLLGLQTGNLEPGAKQDGPVFTVLGSAPRPAAEGDSCSVRRGDPLAGDHHSGSAPFLSGEDAPGRLPRISLRAILEGEYVRCLLEDFWVGPGSEELIEQACLEDPGRYAVRDGLLGRRTTGGKDEEFAKLMRSRLDWVDYWSVDPDPVEGRFTSAWHCGRTRKNRNLALGTPLFRMNPTNPCLAVLLVDIFGNCHQRKVAVDPRDP